MAIDVRGLAPLLEVFDMPSSIAFYRDTLGFEVIATSRPGPNFDWALLSLNGVEIMLNTAYEAAERPAYPIRRESRLMPTPQFISDAQTWMQRTNICARRGLRRRKCRPRPTECASFIFWIPTATSCVCNGRRRSRCAPNGKNATVQVARQLQAKSGKQA
jgi:hypothetical protein